MARQHIMELIVGELAQHFVAPGLENLGIGKSLLVRLGAGRGGCILTLVEPDRSEGVRDAMLQAGAHQCWIVQAGGSS